ncbi:MAG: phosphate transport system permease protein [Paracoccaceae bacterium]|jgi:phosphate transport system permease protein
MAKHFQRKGKRVLGLDKQSWIKGFFGSNAGLSIVVLFLICFFLMVEAFRFFPSHHEGLKVYRKSGQEFVGHIMNEADGYQEFVSYTNQAYFAEYDERFTRERGIKDSWEALLGDIEDDGEDFIEALEEAHDGDDPAALQKAQSDYQAFLVEFTDDVEQENIDSFGRLKNHPDAWQSLLQAALTYDPVEEETPAFIAEAIETQSEGMKSFTEAKNEISSAGVELKDLRTKLVKITADIAKDVEIEKSAADRKAAILEGAEILKGDARAAALAEAEAIVLRENFPYGERVKPLSESKENHEKAVKAMLVQLAAGIDQLPTDLKSEKATELVGNIKKGEERYFEKVERSVEKANAWEYDKEVGFLESIAKFFFGAEWITNSDWTDVYGLGPLFTGSVIISFIALIFAIPLSIGAAIYVNRLATHREQTLIKPSIEMIQAIPSIVLGFFGIMVLGELLQDWSQSPWLSWLPGFPIKDRLNALNAGLLLGLMAVPTIFTLCEDALNNVPRAFTEASLALGASELQTVTRVVVPTAISGILAAVLLGLGRVIGETMVVLLVAGNRISMPTWGDGIGIITQPTHTMTGIIAQEMPEVGEGTLHYRALFLVGLVLFTISLMINIAAQKIIKRLSHV